MGPSAAPGSWPSGMSPSPYNQPIKITQVHLWRVCKPKAGVGIEAPELGCYLTPEIAILNLHPVHFTRMERLLLQGVILAWGCCEQESLHEFLWPVEDNCPLDWNNSLKVHLSRVNSTLSKAQIQWRLRCRGGGQWVRLDGLGV